MKSSWWEIRLLIVVVNSWSTKLFCSFSFFFFSRLQWCSRWCLQNVHNSLNFFAQLYVPSWVELSTMFKYFYQHFLFFSIERARDTVSGFMALSSFLFFFLSFLSIEASDGGFSSVIHWIATLCSNQTFKLLFAQQKQHQQQLEKRFSFSWSISIHLILHRPTVYIQYRIKKFFLLFDSLGFFLLFCVVWVNQEM